MKGTNKTTASGGKPKGTKIRSGGNTVKAGTGGNGGGSRGGKAMKC